MSKVLMVNGNVHGHINPTLPLVKELVKRGEEVFYFSTSEFKQKIEAADAEFIEYGSGLADFFNGFKPNGNHPFYTLIEFILKMDQVVVPLVLKKISNIKFDYMIHDSMFGGGSILSKILSLPAICSCTSFAMNNLPMPSHMFQPGFHPQLDNFSKELETAKKDWEVNDLNIMDIFFKKESLNLVYTSRLFQPQADSFDDSFKFVGPSITERNEEMDFPLEELKGYKVVYISMGTINNDCLEFYKKCLAAFAGENMKVVLSVGKKVDISSFQNIPANFIIKEYLPQLEVLKISDIFVSHGGLNSVSEALYFGVPVIAIPQANDQPMVTRQLVNLGAGIGLKNEEVTPELLRDSVNKALSDKSFRMMSRKVGESFKEAGGYKAAADYVFGFKNQIIR
jgi:MGT family glycosyltransferase